MALGRSHGNVGELLAAARAAQHQPAAAHVSPAGEFGREEKPFAENLEQRLHIFGRRDAAEENDFAGRSDVLRNQICVAFQRNAVAFLGNGDGR